MIIKNANVFGEDCMFHKSDIFIDNEMISDSTSDNTEVDAADMYAIPGLIDVHIHGSVGHDFCDGTKEALDAMSNYLGKNGITAFCPTSMTLPEDRLLNIYLNAGKYKNENGSIVCGINMEGPFVSQEKKGAQNGAYIQNPNIELFDHLNDISNNMVKLVSIAPEEKNAMEFIKNVKNRVVISIAHTTADYNTAMEAFKNGSSHVTHLYNAMLPFTHRAPGVVGAAADSDAMVELICDGVHIHSSVIRATYKMFSDNNIVLISDSMMAAGMEDGEYELGGQAVTVRGNKATLADGTVAGSVTNLMKCMKTAVSFGIPLESAIKTATINPAKSISEDKIMGSISKGKLANIVLLDKDLNIKAVYIKGKKFV